jgi:glycosyltransferase involved in cell wall biosynthesis
MRITYVTGNHPMKKMGGAEYQTWLLAKGLKELGHSSTFLATETSSEDQYIDAAGLSIEEIPGKDSYNKSRFYDLATQKIENSNPDLVYIRNFMDISYIADICNVGGIPYVTLSVHAMETSPFLLGYHPRETFNYLRTGMAWEHFKSFRAIGDAAVHVCNLRGLQTAIEKWYPEKHIETIYNGSPVPELSGTPKESSGQVIWVNNIKRFKRPQIFIELARRLPSYRFLMVGRMYGGSFGKKVEYLLSNAPPNLHYLGPKPIDETNRLIGESDLLLYTSLPVEGFANSFLQAWFRRVPTISYSFELDGVLEKEDIGRSVKEFDDLVNAVDELMRDHEKRKQMGEQARRYAVNQFTVDRMVQNYEALFNELLI